MSPRGLITFVFDDGYESVYHQVVPLFNQRGIPAVFAVPLNINKIEQETRQTITSYPHWLTLKKMGHEIAAHSVTHTDLTRLNPDELTQELSQPQEKLSATTLIYPGGAFNKEVIAAAHSYYRAARTVQKGFAAIPPRNPYILPTYNFTKDNFSVSKANLLALWAYLRNLWLIETYHMVDDHPSDLVHSVTTKELMRHLNFVQKLPLTITTISDQIHD